MKQRVSVKEAAKLLNISEAAVRQRIQRDSIAHERDEESNRVFVILDEVNGSYGRLDEDDTDRVQGYARELIDTLREQLEAERESNRENRRIIAALTSRIPQLEPPRDEPGAPETPDEEPVRVEDQGAATSPETAASRPSWWCRWFG